MSKAAAILWQIVYAKTLAQRIELMGRFIALRQIEEDENWVDGMSDGQIDGMKKVKAESKREQDDRAATLRDKKASKTEAIRSRVLEWAATEWARAPSLSVNRVATLVKQQHPRYLHGVGHSTLRRWLKPHKPR